MALARGILVWLPLQRLLDLYWPGSSFQSIVARRATVVNQLSRAELEYWLALPELEKFRPDLRYVAICTYQGELTKMGDFFLPFFYLRRRAIFLNEAAAVEYFTAARSQDLLGLSAEEMYESNNPSIWASLLSESLIPPPDPYAFNWTEGLRNYFRRELPKVIKPDEDEYALAGTLGLLTIWKPVLEPPQVRAYLQRLVRDTPDGLLADFGAVPADYPDLPRLLIEADAINSILEPGPSDWSILLSALESVHPNVIRLLLPRLGPLSIPQARINEYITPEVVRRAEVILAFLPAWPLLESYREQLLLLTGRAAQHPELWLELLVRLAHPQLAQARGPLLPLDEPYSVLYQPELWLTTVQKGPLSTSGFASRLYARGLFLTLRRQLGQDFTRPWREDPFDIPTPGSRARNAQRMTRDHFRFLLEYDIPLPSLRSIYLPLSEDADAARQLYPPGLELEAKTAEAEEREQRWLEIREELLE